MTTLGDNALEHESIGRPGLGRLLLEGRAVLEMGGPFVPAPRPQIARG